MTNKEIIADAISYIEENLKNEISVADMAKHSRYSLYHFIRLFTSVTGFPPGSYLHKRRLSEAAKILRDTKKKIIEVAYDFQFGSPEAFTRAFKKQFGIKPLNVRTGHALMSFPLVERLTDESIFQSDKAKNAPPDEIYLSEIFLAGVAFFVSDFSKKLDFSDIWTCLTMEIELLANRIVPERYYQVQFWLEKQEAGGLYFFAGAEVKDLVDIPPQFVIKTIPSGKYLKFIHRGAANKVGYTYKYIYNQFLPDTEYRLSHPFNFERYGECYKGPYNEESESEIYIPVG